MSTKVQLHGKEKKFGWDVVVGFQRLLNAVRETHSQSVAAHLWFLTIGKQALCLSSCRQTTCATILFFRPSSVKRFTAMI